MAAAAHFWGRMLRRLAVPALALAAGCGGGAGDGGVFIPSPLDEEVIIHDASGLLTLTLPAGSLTVDTRLILRVVTDQEADTPGPAGRNLLIAWELRGETEGEESGDGQEQESTASRVVSAKRMDAEEESPPELGQPAALTIASSFGLPAAHSLTVYRKSVITGRFEAGETTAAVSEDGSSIALSIARFGVYALFSALPKELPPATPTNLRLLRNTPSTRILRWDSAAGAVAYNIYRSVAETTGFAKVNAAVVLDVTFTDYVTEQATHYYQVRAVGVEGLESAPSNTVVAAGLGLDVVGIACRSGTGAREVNSPEGLLWLPLSGCLLIADTGNHRVQVLDSGLEFAQVAHRFGQLVLQEPVALAANAGETLVYLVDRGLNIVIITDPELGYHGYFGAAGSSAGRFDRPQGVAVLPDGRVVVADSGNDRLQVFTPLGVFLQQFGSRGTEASQFSSPCGLLVAPAGELLVADSGNNRLVSYGAGFESPAVITVATEGVGELLSPGFIQLDYFGNIYVSDRGNSRVVKFDSGGSYLLQFGSQGWRSNRFGADSPSGLAADLARGRLFISDPGNNRVLEYRI